MNRATIPSNNRSVAIAARSISKTYSPSSKSPVQALQNINFEMLGGEIVGLIGPNGAGKSTLMRILLGLLPPDGGSDVRIFGHHPESIESRALIGYQADSQFRSKTVRVRNFLQLRCDLAGSDRRETIDEFLNSFTLTDAASRPLSALSKGMRQKVELIFAFLTFPKLVFLDEPTASLDPPSVFELREFLARRKKEGISVFFSSHNLTEVEQVCDRVLFINHGRLLADHSMQAMKLGSLEKLFKKYLLETGK
jgi:ABC-2 type transport system ATP-binding protein